jgi:hypothetical protein
MRGSTRERFRVYDAERFLAEDFREEPVAEVPAADLPVGLQRAQLQHLSDGHARAKRFASAALLFAAVGTVGTLAALSLLRYGPRSSRGRLPRSSLTERSLAPGLHGLHNDSERAVQTSRDPLLVSARGPRARRRRAQTRASRNLSRRRARTSTPRAPRASGPIEDAGAPMTVAALPARETPVPLNRTPQYAAWQGASAEFGFER